MSKRCDKCDERPVIFIRYSGQHLCSDHFLELIGKRVKKEVRSQGLMSRKGRVALAVSGGKDSLLLLKLMNEILGRVRDIELTAITVDEGITGYRQESIGYARSVSGELGIDHRVVSFREDFGMTLDNMVKRTETGPCSVCGVLRRRALNDEAKRIKAVSLITGHNLDDMSQTVLMNVLSADMKRLKRLGPHLEPIPGFIPRFMPLRTTPETETHLASHILGIPIHNTECPYANTAKRGDVRDILLQAEEKTPGTRHSLLRFHQQCSELIPGDDFETGSCSVCGESVPGGENDICGTCRMLDKIGVKK